LRRSKEAGTAHARARLQRGGPRRDSRGLH
jgi:hypothetical protein